MPGKSHSPYCDAIHTHLGPCQGHTIQFDAINYNSISFKWQDTIQFDAIAYHWSGNQPDGVKCGFIGFSPRLNRALLMEATTYPSYFYERSFSNVAFVAAQISFIKPVIPTDAA